MKLQLRAYTVFGFTKDNMRYNSLCKASMAFSLLMLLSCATPTLNSDHRSTQVIPILTFDQARFGLTEIGSEYTLNTSLLDSVETNLITKGNNRTLRLDYRSLNRKDGKLALSFSLWSSLEDEVELPKLMAQEASGISFDLKSKNPVLLEATLFGKDTQVLDRYEVVVDEAKSSYKFETDLIGAKRLDLEFSSLALKNGKVSYKNTLEIDNLNLYLEAGQAFKPPVEDSEILNWLMQSGFHFFDWNYRALSSEQSIVLERQDNGDQISISGLGYALASYILAVEHGYFTTDEARERTVSVLRWLKDQDWYSGEQGWHGFPYHWYDKEKNPHWPGVSTVDWAMCASALRVVRQYYAADNDIYDLTTELLERPNWEAALDDDGKIVMGFLAKDGSKDPYRWGLSFSEETELVYLEAVASKQLGKDIFLSVKRDKKDGFYPSWFGSGFTYNWAQLWTGEIPVLTENSRVAYLNDMQTANAVFEAPYIGLTAGKTMTEFDKFGFATGMKYFSNQGSAAHGTPFSEEVVHIAPAPYGAVLALPFVPEQALVAIKEYIELGYYHPYLGLPDTVRLGGLPEDTPPVPSWVHFDLNIGSMPLAIDLYKDKIISSHYRADPDANQAIQVWKDSFAKSAVSTK